MEGSVIANRYVINGIIGSGGMAIVYRGYDRETGEEVAVKVLRSEYMRDEAYVRRFEKESQIAIRYSHKNIVKTLDVGCKEGRHYIVMEYVAGMTLKEYISKYGRLKPAEVVRIGRQICDALFYAHSHQLVHRDIKPQNILMSDEGVVKVADFGIAKAPETSTVTISGSNVLGSVHYISPEQARGGITDEKADIYSIGIVLYEMVTGSVPFTGDTPVAVALKHLQDAPRPPREIVPDISKALELVILKAISKEQAARYDNAREMARDLERSILEPEGSYIKIKPPDDTDTGTRALHALRPENLQGQNGTHLAAGSPRRPPVPRADGRWRKQKKAPGALGVLFWVLLALALLVGAYLGMRALIDGASHNGVKLLNYVGQNIDTAARQLETAGVKHRRQDKPSDQPKGIIIAQKPVAGEYLPRGSMLVLTVSSGTQQVEVPDLVGKSYFEAEKLLKDKGLEAGYIGKEDSDLPKDAVVRQDPPAHSYVDIKSKVDIWVSRSANASPPKMPNVNGLTQEDAIELIKGKGIEESSIRIIVRNSQYAAGIVDGQTPEADAPLTAETQVLLYVSSGLPPGYHCLFTADLKITEDNTAVRITVLEGGEERDAFIDTLNTGTYTRSYLLTSNIPGVTTVRVYLNGKKALEDTIVFTAPDPS